MGLSLTNPSGLLLLPLRGSRLTLSLRPGTLWRILLCVGVYETLTEWVCTTYYLAQSSSRLRIYSCAFRAKVETSKKQVSLCAPCWSLLSPVRSYYMGRPESFTGNAHVPIPAGNGENVPPEVATNRAEA